MSHITANRHADGAVIITALSQVDTVTHHSESSCRRGGDHHPAFSDRRLSHITVFIMVSAATHQVVGVAHAHDVTELGRPRRPGGAVPAHTDKVVKRNRAQVLAYEGKEKKTSLFLALHQEKSLVPSNTLA
jgi:hypothetical protein